MKEAFQRFVKPYAKAITAIVGVALVYLSPQDYEWIVGILTAAGVFGVPNRKFVRV